ncbi:MAG: SPASM domain-containing protein [Clostridium neonatale]
MGLKNKIKMKLLSACFKGTYREYNQLLEFKKEREKLYKKLQNKEEEIKEVYEGNKVLDDEVNFLKFRNEGLIKLHDQTVEKYWNNDEKLKKYVCLNPFENIEILSRGEVYTCCSSFIKHNHYIGNINEDGFEEIWNSKKAKQLRYSVSMGKFEYCNEHCIAIKTCDLKGTTDYFQYRKDFNFNYKNVDDCKMDTYPKIITLSCDESCNLYCTSCRNKRKVLSKYESEKLYNTLVEKVLPLMKDCEHLSLLGSGDLFASKACMKFLKHINKNKFPKLNLHIITNAQLLTQSNWEQLDNLKGIPIKMDISIDGAERKTYEKIRRGAKWDILLENLKYVSLLRKNNEISYLRINFVVQLDNFKEMRKFVKLAEKYSADEVWFQRIANWGTIPQAEFSKIDVFDNKNPHYDEVTLMLNRIIDENKIKISNNCF